MNQIVLKLARCGCALLALGAPLAAVAEPIRVIDDSGRELQLERPAQRLISLAPHITEVVYAAGAGEQLVAAVAYSDYPPAAKQLPLVGGYKRINMEAVIALQPDLVIAWESGNGMGQIQQLIDLGLTVYINAPKRLPDIAKTLRQVGLMTGHKALAEQQSARYLSKLADLHARYSRLAPVSVFYQVWNKPLQTLNGTHIISDVIELCGGRNVFADALTLVPTVNVEALLMADPQAIIASGMGEARPEWLDEWLAWPSLRAVKHQHLFFVPPDIVQRHTPRILEGAERICQQLDQVRNY